MIAYVLADPPLPMAQSSNTIEFVESSQPGEYTATVDATMTEQLNVSIKVTCYPSPAVFNWPSDFNVRDQQEPGNDVTVFDLSVSVIDQAVYVFTGKNGNDGQLMTTFSLTVTTSARTLYFMK